MYQKEKEKEKHKDMKKCLIVGKRWTTLDKTILPFAKRISPLTRRTAALRKKKRNKPFALFREGRVDTLYEAKKRKEKGKR